MNIANFYDFSLKELQDFVVSHGLERFRAEQLFRWVYRRRETDIEKMTDISRTVRPQVAALFDFSRPKVSVHRKSVDGTQKVLFDIGNDQTIETVMIPSDERLTLCVSSEVGCNMACKFCYTGKQKLKKRLSTGEIVGQFLGAQDLLEGTDQKISNIVFMGMGEPLDNPDAVFKAIEILHEPLGANLSLKKITVSTSGIVPLIPRVTESGTRLAVSLNGSNDAVRSYIMPINKKWNIETLLQACREHCYETRDKVTFEYVLLKGVTDSIEDARELHKLTRNVPCKINIIPFNEHPGSGFERPSDDAVLAFQKEMIRLGSHVLLRKTMGRDIYAACGQLTSASKGRPETMNITSNQEASPSA